jgi:hypothetical protein
MASFILRHLNQQVKHGMNIAFWRKRWQGEYVYRQCLGFMLSEGALKCA